VRRQLIVLAWLAAAGMQPAAAQGGPAAYAERFEANCVSCHGPGGRSTTALTPSLAGQPGFYAITQLFLLREGRRDNPVMAAVAKGMSDKDLRGYADHIATLPPPPPPAAGGDAARIARGRALAQRHHCTGCHGADLAGGQQVPRLAHQREDYLQHALRGFRAGKRIGYTQAMNEALAGLRPDELDDLAHYLAFLPAGAAAR
jgi:cytochrome c553